MATPPLPDLVACYRHADHLTDVYCTRCGRPICPECMTPVPVGHQCPACVQEGSEATSTGRSGRTRWAPWAPRRVTPVVAALITLNVVVFVLTSIHRTWEFDYAQIPLDVAQGETYRLLTATFVHENLTHLLFNMVTLLIMGPPVEEALGRNRFLVLYLLAGLGGSVCSFVLGPVLIAGVGASGAIVGIFGAWFSLAKASRSDTAAIVFLIAILLAYSFYDTSIDWRAHVGGLLTGALVGAAFAFAARRPLRARLTLEVAVVVGLLGLFAGLVVLRSAQI